MTKKIISDKKISECIDYAKKMIVEYDKEGKRHVICSYCNEKARNSIVPHMKKKHIKEWEQWQLSFLSLYNKGFSSQKIMKKFSDKIKLLSWTVIEREIRKIAEKKDISLNLQKKNENIKEWEPKNFKEEGNTIWSFPSRGKWAVHTNEYRGNWSPYIPRNIIKKYSKENDLVLDPFVGGGTTLIECWLLGRNGIGVDISPHAISITNQLLVFMKKSAENTSFDLPEVKVQCYSSDARNLSRIKDNEIDLICTHPPYAFSIRYTETEENDLSRMKVDDYYEQMKSVAKEFYRILKKGKYCTILIGDIRKNGKLYPLGFEIMNILRNNGFEIEDIVIKEQHKERGTTFYSNNNKIKHIISHEYLLIFKKT